GLADPLRVRGALVGGLRRVRRNPRLLTPELEVDRLRCQTRRAHAEDAADRHVEEAVPAEDADDLGIVRVELVGIERTEARERVAPTVFGVELDDVTAQWRDRVREHLSDVAAGEDRVARTWLRVDDPPVDHLCPPRQSGRRVPRTATMEIA